MEEHDNKKRTAVWLTPGVIRRMDGWLEEDNCKTRSEFIEKALRFYMGYLATEDTSEYLSRALAYNQRIRHPGGFHLINAAAERRWMTSSLNVIMPQILKINILFISLRYFLYRKENSRGNRI